MIRNVSVQTTSKQKDILVSRSSPSPNHFVVMSVCLHRRAEHFRNWRLSWFNVIFQLISRINWYDFENAYEQVRQTKFRSWFTVAFLSVHETLFHAIIYQIIINIILKNWEKDVPSKPSDMTRYDNSCQVLVVFIKTSASFKFVFIP